MCPQELLLRTHCFSGRTWRCLITKMRLAYSIQKQYEFGRDPRIGLSPPREHLGTRLMIRGGYLFHNPVDEIGGTGLKSSLGRKPGCLAQGFSQDDGSSNRDIQRPQARPHRNT